MNQGQVNCSDAFFNNTNDNIEAINYWGKHRNKIPPRLSETVIREAIIVILKSNIFHFDEKHFLQKGYCYGDKMSPNYANLVLAYIKIMLYTNDKGIEYTASFKNPF
jgi:hypothetical protein